MFQEATVRLPTGNSAITPGRNALHFVAFPFWHLPQDVLLPHKHWAIQWVYTCLVENLVRFALFVKLWKSFPKLHSLQKNSCTKYRATSQSWALLPRTHVSPQPLRLRFPCCCCWAGLCLGWCFSPLNPSWPVAHLDLPSTASWGMSDRERNSEDIFDFFLRFIFNCLCTWVQVPWRLGFSVVVSCLLWVMGTELWVFGRAALVLLTTAATDLLDL